MLANYLKITFRHLVKNKLYSFINVAGLAVGICCVLLAMLYWKDERSFDNFHLKGANIYRITTSMVENKNGVRTTTGGTGQVQAPAFKADVPEVQDYVRLLGGGLSVDAIANNKGLQLKVLFADENFFNIFSFPLAHGNPQTALKDFNSAVITEATALKYFNTTDAVGKQLVMDADPSAKRLGKPMIITAVVKNLPQNSSIQFDVLLPFKFMQLSFEDNAWTNAYLSTFVVLHPSANINTVLNKFHTIYAANARQQVEENVRAFGYNPAITYGLQPISAIHLAPLDISMESGVVNGSSPIFSWLFMGIAAFILLMAGINFINISIADALKRAKEVGVRKVSGGSRLQIIMQFLCESAVLCLVAFVLALLMANLVLPVFNSLTGKHILFAAAFNVPLVASFIVVLLAIIMFTGLYPAWILSKFSAKEVLYNKQKLSGRNLFGKSLVVLQFSLAVFLLIATLVYYNQMEFIRTKSLGYNPHEIIETTIKGDRPVMPIYNTLRAETAKLPAVKGISFGGGSSIYNVKLNAVEVPAIHRVIDENYLPVMGLTLKAGRDISPSYPADSGHAVLVNEAFVKAAGLSNPLGAVLRVDEYFDKEPKTIVGVIKDYHNASLREPIKPMVMFMSNWYGGEILVKLEKSQLKQGLAAFEAVYKKAIPKAIYQYHFVDELNAQQYEQEQRWQKVVSMATILSIAICCLGLFGLAHLSTHQRVKEIGVRKVLGATAAQLVTALSAGFLKLVLLAIIIATPLAGLIMHNWLQNFAYRINLGAGIFIVAGVLSVVVALVAVSFQAIKAAMANPVDALRNE